ncbi:hypothetical protein FNU76_20775 [Chitinimonas arctica]|uniref:Uncharacterized protein n=1 Tax=Chitinimonas arctica TaxID=2594795 RepID=A0A516SKM7_9NEIS|nr:hypothetical protein [Chitinimonas arctica]QDQ28588.1 hypothetical protein FNU76_20775 [Chitinimonas arctica]
MPAFDSQYAETALAAYLNLLKNKGAATGIITRRKHFLRHLLSALETQADSHITDDDAGYRRAVDGIVHKFPDDQQIEIITTSREFYPFWIGDLKTIARLNAADALSLEHSPVDLRGSLVDMFERLDADPWSRSEQHCLQAYIARMAELGTQDAVMDIRERLLLLLLYVIRHAEATPTAYRAGVDAMLTLFSKEDTRRLFIEMAREFFYFWNGFNHGEQTTLAHAA